MQRWLVKTEPESYCIDDLAAERTKVWNGVRNPLAQQYMRQMELDDPVLIYHSGRERAIVGLAKVARVSLGEQQSWLRNSLGNCSDGTAILLGKKAVLIESLASMSR